MPPKALPHCKFAGCTAERYVYPSGAKCQYCAEHMRHRKAKRRGDMASMTGQMQDTLVYLRQAKEDGTIWAELGYPFAHGQTLINLFERDWIFASDGVDGRRLYKITTRGEEALKLYEQPYCRRDGLCPSCGEQPRHVRASGTVDGYCLDCLRERGRRKRASGQANGDVTRPCSRCHKRPRRQYPGGEFSTYCEHCTRVNKRASLRRTRKAVMKAIQAGGPVPLCQRCKREPRRVFPNSISNYCPACAKQVLHEVKVRAAARKYAALLKGLAR